VGLSDSANQGLLLRNFLILQGLHYAGRNSVPGHPQLHGTTRSRQVWWGAHPAHLYPLLLDEGSSRQRRGDDSAQGDIRAVRERTDEAATGESVCVRAGVPNRVARRRGQGCGLTPPKGRFEPATFTQKRRYADQ
jgi:hypothetical protein